MSHILRSGVLAAVLSSACSAATVVDRPGDDAAPPDASRRDGGAADGGDVPRVDGGTTVDTGTGDGSTTVDSCVPQVAYEDPEVDSDGCDFDPTPYQWDGSMCVFVPLCFCAGPDCGARFDSFDGCAETYAGCPMEHVDPAYPEAWLSWYVQLGESGTGPAYHVDASGQVLYWRDALSLEPSPDDADESFSVGTAEANRLFDELEAIRYGDFPHEETLRVSPCYPAFWYRLYPVGEPQGAEYVGPADLLPEMHGVFDWLDAHLRARVGRAQLPISFCDWE